MREHSGVIAVGVHRLEFRQVHVRHFNKKTLPAGWRGPNRIEGLTIVYGIGDLEFSESIPCDRSVQTPDVGA